MAKKTLLMLKKSLDAIGNLNIDAALNVCKADDEVDIIKAEAYDIIKKEIKKNPQQVGRLINLFLISRHIERIADHATNIAEEVIYDRRRDSKTRMDKRQ